MLAPVAAIHFCVVSRIAPFPALGRARHRDGDGFRQRVAPLSRRSVSINVDTSIPGDGKPGKSRNSKAASCASLMACRTDTVAISAMPTPVLANRSGKSCGSPTSGARHGEPSHE